MAEGKLNGAGGSKEMELYITSIGAVICSNEFQEKLKKRGMICSMRQKRSFWDNAPMEIWFNSFKSERVLGIRYATP